LDVVKNVFIAQAAVALNIYRLDEFLARLRLRPRWVDKQGADSNDGAQKDEQGGTTSVHNCYFPQTFENRL
jgi:hypothetical protein